MKRGVITKNGSGTDAKLTPISVVAEKTEKNCEQISTLLLHLLGSEM